MALHARACPVPQNCEDRMKTFYVSGSPALASVAHTVMVYRVYMRTQRDTSVALPRAFARFREAQDKANALNRVWGKPTRASRDLRRIAP